MLTILIGRAKTGKSDTMLRRMAELGESSQQILKKGTQRAIEVSNKTVSEIRNAIGINYFNDKTFIDKFVL